MEIERIRINFCQNLRHLRKVHNLIQKKMAQIIGISVSRLGRIESCDPAVRISGQFLCRVCDCFDISSDSLLYENWIEILESRYQ